MDIIECEYKGLPVLVVVGDVDHDEAMVLASRLERACSLSSRASLLLDFSNVSYIDSGGLGVLMGHARRLTCGDWMGVVRPSPFVRRIMEMVGLENLPSVRILDSLEDAERMVRPED